MAEGNESGVCLENPTLASNTLLRIYLFIYLFTVIFTATTETVTFLPVVESSLKKIKALLTKVEIKSENNSSQTPAKSHLPAL